MLYIVCSILGIMYLHITPPRRRRVSYVYKLCVYVLISTSVSIHDACHKTKN